MLLVILAEPAAPRCQAAGRKRWVLGTRSWVGVWEQGLHGISATSRLRSTQAPVAAGDSDPFPLHPLEAAQRGSTPANQCLKRAPKELLVALGPARSTSMLRSARAMAGTRQGWR
jgi:hypothetical protein